MAIALSNCSPTLAVEPATAPPGVAEVMGPYMGVFFAAFFGALLLSPVMRMLAMRNGIIDWPDLKRKEHPQPVAYLGGVAIFLGWLAGVVSSHWIEPHVHVINALGAPHVSFPIGIVLGAALVMFTGLFDDLYGISPRVKVGGQLLAGAALASENVGLELAETSLSLFNLPTHEPIVVAVGTAGIALFVLGGCNAMNLLDGLDGLASGVMAIGCLGLLVIVTLVALRAYAPGTAPGSDVLDDPVRLTLCLAALGAVLGFLPFNSNPATIFMGDAGSLLLGFLAVAAILLLGDVSGAGPRLVTAALIIFALPITDTILAIVRRTMRGQAIAQPDSEHLHHILRRGGLGTRQTVAVLYGAAAAFAVLGCMLVALRLQWRYVMAVFVVLFGFVLVTAYKYGQRQRMLVQVNVGVGSESPPARSPGSPSTPVGEASLKVEPGPASGRSVVETEAEMADEADPEVIPVDRLPARSETLSDGQPEAQSEARRQSGG